MKSTFRIALLTSTLLSGAAWAEDVTLTIESWRNDDLTIWQDTHHPGFRGRKSRHQGGLFARLRRPNTTPSLNSANWTRARQGDLITCRPFDASLELYNKGHLADLSGPCRDGQFLAGCQIGLADG